MMLDWSWWIMVPVIIGYIVIVRLSENSLKDLWDEDESNDQ